MCLNAVCCMEMLFSVKLKSLPPKSTCENPAETLGCMFCSVFLHYFCSCFILYSSFSLISHLSLPAFPTFVVSSHNVFCTCLCLLWTYKLWVLLALADNPCMYSAFNSAVFPVAWLIFCWISYQTLIYNNRYQIFGYLILNLWILNSFGLCSIERYIIKRLWWLI